MGRRWPARVCRRRRDALGRQRDERWGAGRWEIEDFWQSNKILVARSTGPGALRAELVRPLEPAGERRRAAFFGSSFNPIHLGHLRVARDLLDLYGSERVVFVPNGDWYRKRQRARFRGRLHRRQTSLR